MDQMDYRLDNPSRPPPSHPDAAVHAAAHGWMSHGHGQGQTHFVAPPSHWMAHSPVVPQPQFYHQPSQHPGPHVFYPLGPNGGLPPPEPSLRGFPLPEPLPGLSMHHPPRPWNHHFQPMPPPANGPMLAPAHMAVPTGSELPFGLVVAPAAGRSLPFQPPADPTLASPGATSGPNSMPRSLYLPSAENSANSYGQQMAASHFSVPPPHHHFNSLPSRRTTHHLAPPTHRAPRPAIPPPSFVPWPQHHPEATGLPQPSTSDRRRTANARARRAMNARVSMGDSSRDSDGDGDDHTLHDHDPAGHGTGQGAGMDTEEPAVRQMQVLRGAMSSKMVVSRSALQSLQSVSVEDLPENERTCVICYNDYGVETPEGINEAPLRLPRCRHVFGDHCIKKWFEDSDSCPYCRDKLHSEPKHRVNSARAFVNMMRMRGGARDVAPEELYVRFMATLSGEGGQTHVAERRSLPDDSGENRRRTRARRNPREDLITAVENWLPPPPITPIPPSRIVPQTQHFPSWSMAQRRAALVALNPDADFEGHRRLEPHSNFQVGAVVTNMNVDMTLPNPLQAHRTDGMENMTSGSVPEQQPADAAQAPADVNRNRPW